MSIIQTNIPNNTKYNNLDRKITNNNLYTEIKIFFKINFHKTMNYFIYNKNIWQLINNNKYKLK
jgi:hypothetical protein